MKQTSRLLCAITVVTFTLACGGSKSESDQATQSATPTAAATPTDPAQAAAAAIKQMQDAAKGTAAAVPFESLVALLPEFSGWTKGKPRGESYNMGITMSRAQVSYTKDDHELDLEIVDSSYNQMALAPISMDLAANYSQRSTHGYQKGITRGGHPGWEEWENEPKSGKIGLVVAKRFIVTADGRDLDSIEIVRALVQAIDLNKLASLK